MKKIMILGAGNAQKDAILYLKEKGHFVYACSYRIDDEKSICADKFALIDIKDKAAVEAYVKQEKIELVYSVGSDLAMPTAAVVSERLGLPSFVSFETAEICQKKHLLREALGTDFEGNIPFVVCESKEQAKRFHHFPGMLKPVDAQGQRGCIEVQSKEDILNHFDRTMSYSKCGKVILEAYVEGDEVSANAFFHNGEMECCIVSDRIVFDEFPGGIIKEHKIPTKYSGRPEEIRVKNLVKRVSDALGIKNGPVYMQIKIRNGQPYVIEVTPRLDGCHMWRLIKAYCGIDLLAHTFARLLNEKTELLCMQRNNRAMTLKFMCEVPGAHYKQNKYDCTNAEYVCWYYKDDDVVRELNGFMEKGGYQIFYEK